MVKSSSNQRIVKNTMMLYIRMFLIMGVSFYTSRVILKALGVEDFGIYNVVGGVVSMLGLIKGVMSGATSRYLNFALGKEDIELARKSFNVSLIIYIVLSAAFVLLAETVGLWFLNTQLVIPEDRIVAANWIYQFTIISSVNQMIAVPFNAAVIAREEMSVFAYISVLEVVLRLLIVYLLFISRVDKLIAYGFLYMLTNLLITEIYRLYCRKHYPESHFNFYKDKSLYIEILSYSSWNLMGQIAKLIKGQGLNILLNMFFNPAVNASRALSYQINNGINQFVQNFYIAVGPQVTKYYARNEMENMFNLVCRSAKMALFLFVLFALPVSIEAPMLIQLWLGQQPENVVEFVRIILLISMLDSIQIPLKTSAQATGKIAKYEMTISVITILNIPISFALLKFGYPAITVFVVSLCLSTVSFIARLILLQGMISFPIIRYLNYVVVRSVMVILLSAIIPLLLHNKLADSTINSFLVILVALVCEGLVMYFLGLNRQEKEFVNGIVKNRLNIKKK